MEYSEAIRKRFVFGDVIKIAPYNPQPTPVFASCWLDDKASDVCCLCGKKFNLINRRHHCRRCGQLFCKVCCPATGGTENEPDRLCILCQLCLSAKTKKRDEIIAAIEKQNKIVRSNCVLCAELAGLLSYIALEEEYRVKVMECPTFAFLTGQILALQKKRDLANEERYALLQYLSLVVNLSATLNIDTIQQLCANKVHEVVLPYIYPSYDLAIREMAVWTLRGLSQNSAVAIVVESTNVPETLNSFNSLILSRSTLVCVNTLTLLANIIRANPQQFSPFVIKSQVFGTVLRVAGLSTGGGSGVGNSASPAASPAAAASTGPSGTAASQVALSPNEEMVVAALRTIRCTVWGSAPASFRVLECHSRQLFDGMDSRHDRGLMCALILLSAVQTLLALSEEELGKLQRVDFTKEEKPTYEEVLSFVDISRVFQTLLDAAEEETKKMFMTETSSILQKVCQYKLRPTNISDKGALIAAAAYIISANAKEIKEYIGAL